VLTKRLSSLPPIRPALKTETDMDVVIPATRKEAKLAVFDYIETFFNSKRRPRSLGQISPVAFEQKYEKLKIKPA
jgi:transposase InsO family protein